MVEFSSFTQERNPNKVCCPQLDAAASANYGVQVSSADSWSKLRQNLNTTKLLRERNEFHCSILINMPLDKHVVSISINSHQIKIDFSGSINGVKLHGLEHAPPMLKVTVCLETLSIVY